MKQKKYFEYKTYKSMINIASDNKEKFGLDSNFKWYSDPRQFFISLSRYKFVSKLLEGKNDVLEIGCADGFNSRIVKQTVKNLYLTDNEKIFQDSYYSYISDKWKCEYFLHDFIKYKAKKKYDAIYFLDVFEHIAKKNENIFISNIARSLKKNGCIIVGAPSLEFQKYSNRNKGHINCKTGKDIKKFFEKFFYNVFLFSMNDEVVSTSFDKMACYLFVLCTNKKH